MIDHLLKFSTEDEAKADPVVGSYWTPAKGKSPGSWRADICIPGVQVWQPADDVTSQQKREDGSTIDVVTHSYLPFFYIAIAHGNADAKLQNHPNCVIVADRIAAERKEAFMKFSALTAPELASHALAPMFAGTPYKFGEKLG